MLKYSIHPDFVMSRNDGDVHFVDAGELMYLYGVSPHECIVIKDGEGRRTYTQLMARAEGLCLIPLRPRFDGNYTLNRKEGMT